MSNGLAALGLGIYFALVVYRGNASKLWPMLGQEAGFVKWGFAVAVLWWLASRKEFSTSGIGRNAGELGAALLTVAIVGVAMKIATDKTILDSIKAVWTSLPNATKTSSGVSGSF